MMMKNLLLILALLFIFGCKNNILNYEAGDLEFQVNTGKHWLHDFPLFLGLEKKNPPQFAIWLTDLDTNYIETIFATHKIAHEAWEFNHRNRRIEALPFWAHNRGIIYDDGLYLPTKEKTLTDGLSGATPKSNPQFKYQPNLKKFLVFAEFNHSVDFNDSYPESAKEGTDAYSGGAEGSGQPAIVFAGLVDLESDTDQWKLSLIGHSSPDGSTGKLYNDFTGLTSALTIALKGRNNSLLTRLVPKVNPSMSKTKNDFYCFL